MAFVYYKFKSDRGDFRSLPIVGRFISVYDFKSEIFASKYYGSGKDFNFLITDAKTDQLFADDSLIPACSSIVIRRVPGLPRLPIVIGDERLPKIEYPSSSSAFKEHESFDFHDFGPDTNSIHATSTVIQSDSKEDKVNVGFKLLPDKSFVKDFVGKTQIQTPPPQGYVCNRCKVAGHYIRHCPTNGDPSFDFQKVNYKSANAIGISSSNSSGITYAYASTSSSHSSVGSQIAPELYCPLCKNVMKDAELTKCCFASFCDKCIRNRVVYGSACVCQRKIGVYDILPNMTLRQTINRILNVNECKRKQPLAVDEAELTKKRQSKEDTYLELGKWQKTPLLRGQVQRQGQFFKIEIFK